MNECDTRGGARRPKTVLARIVQVQVLCAVKTALGGSWYAVGVVCGVMQGCHYTASK